MDRSKYLKIIIWSLLIIGGNIGDCQNPLKVSLEVYTQDPFLTNSWSKVSVDITHIGYGNVRFQANFILEDKQFIDFQDSSPNVISLTIGEYKPGDSYLFELVIGDFVDTVVISNIDDLIYNENRGYLVLGADEKNRKYALFSSYSGATNGIKKEVLILPTSKGYPLTFKKWHKPKIEWEGQYEAISIFEFQGKYKPRPSIVRLNDFPEVERVRGTFSSRYYKKKDFSFEWDHSLRNPGVPVELVLEKRKFPLTILIGSGLFVLGGWLLKKSSDNYQGLYRACADPRGLSLHSDISSERCQEYINPSTFFEDRNYLQKKANNRYNLSIGAYSVATIGCVFEIGYCGIPSWLISKFK